MYDVVIVGAGVMGSATAYWLSRAGKRVALLDKYSPAHVRAASADESRMVRYQYRGQTIYTEMVASRGRTLERVRPAGWAPASIGNRAP